MGRPTASRGVPRPALSLVGTALLALAGCGRGEEVAVRTDPLRVWGAFDGAEYQLFLCTEPEEPVPVVPGPLVYELAEFHAEVTPGLASDEVIFVDLLGEGVQRGDEVSFDALEVYRASWEKWGCAFETELTGAYLFAEGTESSWSVELSRDSLLVMRPDAPEIRVAHTGFDGDPAGGWSFSLDVEGVEWSFDFAAEPCSDPVSGAYSHLGVAIARPDGVWPGCGFVVSEM